MATYISMGLVLWASLANSIWLNYFRCSTETEPYVYVQTYNDIFKLIAPPAHPGQTRPHELSTGRVT